MSCSCSGGTVATKYYLTENPTPRKNDFQRPAKGDSTPAFACQCAAIAAGKTDCKIQFASQMWAARPHLGSIFEKLLHRKTFSFACGSHFIMHYKNLAALLPFGHTVHSPDAQHAP